MLAEKYFQFIIAAFGVIGFVVGYVTQQLSHSLVASWLPWSPSHRGQCIVKIQSNGSNQDQQTLTNLLRHPKRNLLLNRRNDETIDQIILSSMLFLFLSFCYNFFVCCL